MTTTQTTSRSRFINLDMKLPKSISLRVGQSLTLVDSVNPTAGKIIAGFNVPIPPFGYVPEPIMLRYTRLPGQPRDTGIVATYKAESPGQGKITVNFGIKGTRSYEPVEIKFSISA